MWREETFTTPNKARVTKCLDTLAYGHLASDSLLIITYYLPYNNRKASMCCVVVYIILMTQFHVADALSIRGYCVPRYTMVLVSSNASSL